MKKLLVMMLMVLGLSVGGFAKDNTFTKSKTEPRESNEHALYHRLINNLERECAYLNRGSYLACNGFLAKYEDYFLTLRGLDSNYQSLYDLKADDLAYIYKVFDQFVMNLFYKAYPNLSELTDEEKKALAEFEDKIDVCANTSKEDKKFVGCK